MQAAECGMREMRALICKVECKDGIQTHRQEVLGSKKAQLLVQDMTSPTADQSAETFNTAI